MYGSSLEGTKEGIGLEGSSIIRLIRPNVKKLKISDRVLIFDHGCFSTRFVTSSRLSVKVLNDLGFKEQNRGLLQFLHDDWQTTVSPKVYGALNLHEVLTKEEFDFFVPISCVVGQPGQGNYSAANTFLDSFFLFSNSR